MTGHLFEDNINALEEIVEELKVMNNAREALGVGRISGIDIIRTELENIIVEFETDIEAYELSIDRDINQTKEKIMEALRGLC